MFHPHREWGCASPGMYILTGKGPGSTSSPGTRYDSPGMTGNGICHPWNRDVPHRECTSSPEMHIITGNAHSLYRVLLPRWSKTGTFLALRIGNKSDKISNIFLPLSRSIVIRKSIFDFSSNLTCLPKFIIVSVLEVYF